MSTGFLSFLNDQENWTRPRYSLPKLTERRLAQVRNARLGTERNNDFLEFVGDRIVNLICALPVAEVSFSPDQQVVDRLLSNNDTLGRLAYQLHLDEYVQFDNPVAQKVYDWSPRVSWPAPKVLADLFEAYAGAVYEENGWDFTKYWLSTLFKPLIEKANEDYLKSGKVPPRYPGKGTYVTYERLHSTAVHVKFHEFLENRSMKLVAMAEPALSALPKSTKFVFGANGDIATDCDKVEIATHLVKFWVCEIFISLYPETREALLRGPHLVSSITFVVTNAWAFGYLGSILGLASCFDLEDPDFSLFDKSVGSPSSGDSDVSNSDKRFRGKLAQAVYTMIGWYYSQDAQAAEQWGIGWLVPLVTRAHDLIIQEPNFNLPTYPNGIGNVNLYANTLKEIGRDSEESVVTTQDDFDAYFTAMVLDDKETRGRVFLPRNYVSRRTPLRTRSL